VDFFVTVMLLHVWNNTMHCSLQHLTWNSCPLLLDGFSTL